MFILRKRDYDMSETIPQTTRVCTKCGLPKLLSDFIIHKVGHTKEYGLICRKCRSGSILEDEDTRWMQQAFTLDKAFHELDIVNEAKIDRELVEKQEDLVEKEIVDQKEENRREATEETDESRVAERNEQAKKDKQKTAIKEGVEQELDSREKISGHYKDSFFAQNNLSQENRATAHVSFEKTNQLATESNVQAQQQARIKETTVKGHFFAEHQGKMTQETAKVTAVNVGTGIAAGALFTKQQQTTEAQKVQANNTERATQKSQVEHQLESQQMRSGPKAR